MSCYGLTMGQRIVDRWNEIIAEWQTGDVYDYDISSRAHLNLSEVGLELKLHFTQMYFVTENDGFKKKHRMKKVNEHNCGNDIEVACSYSLNHSLWNGLILSKWNLVFRAYYLARLFNLRNI